jgi:cob(I)alamin adenosyltransferase
LKEKSIRCYNTLYEIQNVLVGISSFIASNQNEKYILKQLNFEEILEKEIDRMEMELPQLKNFIHPGGSLEASHIHICRTIARRVERRYVNFYGDKEEKKYLKIFNRLSDYLFVLARYMNHIQNIDDVIIKN